jgi:Fe-S-cluster-containing hydrogenase component 2/CRP-like cAMP-binding protein
MAKQLVVNPEPEPERRDSDIEVTAEQLLKTSLFASLKQKPTLDRFPGYVRLRRYAAGEVICRQGEPGNSAFYLLTAEDVIALRRGQLAARPDGSEADVMRQEIADLETRLEQDAAPGSESRRAATAYLAVARPTRPRRVGLLTRLGRRLTGGPAPAPRRPQPLYIPMDGPTAIAYDSRQAALYEGEVFGEMSCLQRTPRSATVVADRDWYALEMLRNIFDTLYKDAGYRARTDDAYKKRVLEMQLRNLPLFADLSDEQLDVVRREAELVSFEAGEIIWDEHDRSDSMCVIRSGVVRVLTDVSHLLRPEDVADAARLCAALAAGDGQAGTPAARAWQGLSEEARAAARGGAVSAALVFALNDLIKDRRLSEAAEFQAVKTAEPLQAATRGWPAPKAWSDAQARAYNHLLLEAAFPGCLRPCQASGGPPRTLAYCGRGELIGELGMIDNGPRTATCLAAGHANDAGGRVELLRISARLFARLRRDVALRQRVEQIAGERHERDRQRGQAAPWDDSRTPLLSDKAAELGLVQGQRLMLIDLDRCTRCDECVRACVATHDDGETRLFLDGPRFGNYLVPTTCRSCLDPVCMVGCPVGSIRRGSNGQMRIEDWCIGCGLCAKNCPYGSIHMRDVGVIPEEAAGWRYLPAAAVKDARWQERGPGGRWLAGGTPFRFDRDFRAALPGGAADGVALCFCYEFRISSEVLREGGRFKMEVTSVDPAAAVWVNGHELKTDDKPKRGKREFQFAGRDVLRAGRNLVAARVQAVPGSADVLFGLRLDEVRQPVAARVRRVPGSAEAMFGLPPDDVRPPAAVPPGVEVAQKAVTERAVVCDLCSEQYGQVPACVNACPHDAALRVDARRFEFRPR